MVCSKNEVCVNTLGSSMCQCSPGYYRLSNLCKGTSGYYMCMWDINHNNDNTSIRL